MVKFVVEERSGASIQDKSIRRMIKPENQIRTIISLEVSPLAERVRHVMVTIGVRGGCQ